MKETFIIPLTTLANSSLPFKIQTLDTLMEADDFHSMPHSHDYFEMLWITSGTGWLSADMQECATEPGFLYCIKPGQVHYLQLQPGAGGFIFSFTQQFLESAEEEFDCKSRTIFFRLFSSIIATPVGKDIQPQIDEIMMKMMIEFNNELSFKAQLLKRYFKIFLIYLGRQYGDTLHSVPFTRETEIVTKFMEMLDRDFRRKKMVADYAMLLFVTPNYLNSVIKKCTGYSAGHHIRQRVVLEAKRMGMYSNAGMKEIAYELGFTDSAHFSKFFKNTSGINFSNFKKRA